MENFTMLLNKIEVSISNIGVMQNKQGQYRNIKLTEFLPLLKNPEIGEKNGSHFVRATLKTGVDGEVLQRSNNSIKNESSLIIIDCDKHINSNGEEVDGAPDPYIVSQKLKKLGIGHFIYGTHSHYEGTKGNRYRIFLLTKTPYNKTQLGATIDAIITLINCNLGDKPLANSRENKTWAQPWYLPRRSLNSLIPILYVEYLDGDALEVVNPIDLPPTTHTKNVFVANNYTEASPIQAFNKRNPVVELLEKYGYKKTYAAAEYEKWLSPHSKSGMAGITVKDNKFFSHHNDELNDGYWHDSFDLMRISEGLTENEAVKIAAHHMHTNRRIVNQNSQNLVNNPPQGAGPQPLPESRPPVLPFHANMLPAVIGDYIRDVADRQQSSPDFAAAAALVGLSALLGRKALICPKQLDDWTVTPNQWGAIIGRPSAMKTPSMKEALKPLRQFDAKAAEQFKSDKKNYEEELQLIDLEKAAAKNKAKRALKAANRDEAREALQLGDDAILPTWQRLVVNDATIEKLGELLNENPNGLILVRDELSGWLSKLSKEENQGDRAFYLECFDGDGHYTYDRIGRGTIEIQNCTLSIIGGIQPSKIASLIRDAIKGISDDGLIQRFQLAIWPDDLGSWEWIDRAPNQEAKKNYYAVFESLHALRFNLENEAPRCFRFSKEAQDIFIEWMTEIQDAARSSDIHPAFESHMLKMPQTIAGLALLFEIIDGGREAVGLEATARALDWADYLLSHARRLYSLATQQSLDGAKLILERKSKLPNPFAARDIQRKDWSGLDSTDAVHDALSWLLDYGHIREEILSSTDTNGRPKVAYHWCHANSSKEN